MPLSTVPIVDFEQVNINWEGHLPVVHILISS